MIMEFDELSKQMIGCAIEVHRILGPGLFEESYKQCLANDLRFQGIQFEDSLILELKAVERLLPLHQAQLITYLKLTRIHAGLLINFNVQKLKAGLKRLVV